MRFCEEFRRRSLFRLGKSGPKCRHHWNLLACGRRPKKASERHASATELAHEVQEWQAERELQQLVDFISQIIVVLSPEGNTNRVGREYTGLTRDEYRSVDVIGRVIHPDDVQRMRALRELGLARIEPFEIDARTLGKDGVYRWMLYRYNP
jgi:PAS domain-containing protein